MIKLALKTCYQEKKCDKVPFEKCEDGFLDKCKETPKKVGQKVKYSFLLLHCITKSFQVSKHRCVWPKRTIVDDTSCQDRYMYVFIFVTLLSNVHLFMLQFLILLYFIIQFCNVIKIFQTNISYRLKHSKKTTISPDPYIFILSTSGIFFSPSANPIHILLSTIFLDQFQPF